MKQTQHSGTYPDMREILVLLWSTGACGRDFLAGFSRYARGRPNWNIRLLPVREAFSSDVVHAVKAGRYHGVVTDEDTFLENPFLAELSDTALVVFGRCPETFPKTARPIAFVQNDDEGIGATAAEHFLKLGNFRSFGFVMPNGRHLWAEARSRGFSGRLAKNRREVSVFGTAPEGPPLAEWLTGLPKPAAVMVAWDNRAVEVVEVCRTSGVAVPEQVSVMGVDNDELLCNFTTPSITSIQPDHEDDGFHVALALDGLFTERRRRAGTPVVVVRKGFWRIVERESTASPAPATHLILRAQEFIRKNAANPIHVEDVVQYLGVSRRLAEMRFRSLQGRTIREEIEECRLEEVAKQILTTRLPMRKIAVSCGFRNVSHLGVLFRKRYGTSLLGWRRAHGTKQPS